MPRPARQPSPAQVEPAAAPEIRMRVWHQRCARCGAEATLGIMLTDGAGTGPWLCHPSPFLGRAGCRLRPSPQP